MTNRFIRQPLALALALALAGLLVVGAGCTGSTLEEATETISDPFAASSRSGSERPTLTISSPASGATVVSPFTIEVQTENLQLAPKGAVRDGEGHMHVITSGRCVPAGEVIVDDDIHVHYGDGAAELVMDLEPGDYDLCIQAGDGFHVALGIVHQLSVTVVG